MKLPLRTIEEVKARLVLEPTIKEIYVEGIFDRDLYRWGLKKLGKTVPVVYPISTIEVPSNILLKYNLTSGERQRLYVFSMELDLSGNFVNSVMCIIDSDFDYILEIDEMCKLLCGTSGTAAELLFLNHDLLIKFYEMVLSIDSAKDKLVASLKLIIPILRKIFLLRAANHSLKLNWSLIDLESELKSDTAFDFDVYFIKVINKNHGIADKERVVVEIARLEKIAFSLADEKVIHGHDFVCAFRKNLINSGIKRKLLADSDEVGRILLGMLEWNTVKNDNVFLKISNF